MSLPRFVGELPPRQEPAITRHDVQLSRPAQAPQRARGRAVISAKVGASAASVLDGLHQSGSMRVLFPRAAEALEAVLLNTAGGITGGDRFDISATAGAGAGLVVTTQAAERAYRAIAGEVGEVTNQIKVAAGARLGWLPQETILFEGCALRRRLTVDLASDARFLMVEPVCFGRLSSGERLQSAAFDDTVQINRDGKPIYRDRVQLAGDIDRVLDRPAVANGARAMATFVTVAPEAEALVDALRSMLPATAGVSLLAPDILVGRVVALDGHMLRQALVPALTHLTSNSLPKCWRL